MKVYVAALVVFLLAFAGLATALIFKRKGLRGGCGSIPGTGGDCQCKTAAGHGSALNIDQHEKENKIQACDD